jgi:two-component system chemotaxis response regulator CheB
LKGFKTLKPLIRVLVVDDSLVCRELLSEQLNQSKDIQVVGQACSGKEAIVLNRKLLPDLITMDVMMPGLDGYATIEEIMSSLPVPILVVTSVPEKDGVGQNFKALSAGALDILEKSEVNDEAAEVLRNKVRLLAGVPVIHHTKKEKKQRIRSLPGLSTGHRFVVAITSSTGGPKALVEILGALPRKYGAAILVTQHMPRAFTSGFVAWLDHEVALDVSAAREGDTILPGRVLVAPGDRHLVMRSSSTVGLSDEPPVGSHRPSGTLMFSSVAGTCGSKTVGVVLSGMGRDGADGLLDLHRAGGLCIAQDEASSLVFGMPKVAIDMGAVDEVLDIVGITDLLVQSGGERE